MHALRLAKAYTGRPKVIKMEGAYHGLHDSVMISVKPTEEQWGHANSPSPVPASAGVSLTGSDTLVAEFNNLSSLEQALKQSGQQVAAVIIEPVMMVLLGIVAFTIVAAVLLPIYGLAGNSNFTSAG